MTAGDTNGKAHDPGHPLRRRFVQGRIRRKPIKYTRASRKHKIGRVHVRAALTNAGDPKEIVAIERPDCVSVIHVMPMAFRRRTS